jgi:hypothetical protein
MAAAIRVYMPPESAVDQDLDTMRLPTSKLTVKQILSAALSASSSPPLSTLGAIMSVDDLDRKLELMRTLVDGRTDLRLVDAAVRDVDLCEHVVPAFRGPDFEQLCPADPIQACLAVFHPAVPPHVVRQCLAHALEACAAAPSPEGAYPWHGLLKAAVLVLCRRARDQLDDDVYAAKLEGDPRKLELLQRLAEWACRTRPGTAPPLPDSMAASLERIAGRSPAEAERAALELMIHFGFIGLSTELG